MDPGSEAPGVAVNTNLEQSKGKAPGKVPGTWETACQVNLYVKNDTSKNDGRLIESTCLNFRVDVYKIHVSQGKYIDIQEEKMY